MFFNNLAEFSRTNCISICLFLVPANLVATLLTIITAIVRPIQLWQAAALANILALLMIWHVSTWYMVGIVTATTYVLLGLGSICFFINLVAIAYVYNSVRLRKRDTKASL